MRHSIPFGTDAVSDTRCCRGIEVLMKTREVSKLARERQKSQCSPAKAATELGVIILISVIPIFFAVAAY